MERGVTDSILQEIVEVVLFGDRGALRIGKRVFVREEVTDTLHVMVFVSATAEDEAGKSRSRLVRLC